MILEWASNYLADLFLSLINMFRILYISNESTLEQSTNSSLLCMGDAALVSSSWLSTSDGPEHPFDQAADSHFGVLLLSL